MLGLRLRDMEIVRVRAKRYGKMLRLRLRDMGIVRVRDK